MKNNSGYTRLEKETTLVFNEEESNAIVWSASDIFERKMIALGLHGTPYGGGMRWNIPKGWIKIRKPRVLTEEQHKRASEHAKKHLSR